MKHLAANILLALTLLLFALPAPAPAQVAEDAITQGEFLAALYRYHGEITQWKEDAATDPLGLRQGPDEAPLSREDMMLLLYRYVNASGLSFPTAGPPRFYFSDAAQISPGAQEAVLAGYWAKIIEGFPNGGFRPQERATRAQAAAVLSRLNSWREIWQANPLFSSSNSSLECYDLSGIINNGADILLTERGLLAAYSMDSYETMQGRAVLYNLSNRQLLAAVEVSGPWCRRIDETATGVNFTFILETVDEEDNVSQAVSTLSLDWQGNAAWQYPATFRLPFGGGEVAEGEAAGLSRWGRDINFIDGKSGEKRVLASYNDEIVGADEYARLELFKVLDENRFIYMSKYDFWSLGTYIYDAVSKQSIRVTKNNGYPLGFGGGRLMCAFDSYGTDGMEIIDLNSLNRLCRISYNNAGPSRAALSYDGQLVMAIDTPGLNDGRFWLFSAQTGQLLLECTVPGLSPLNYGFWQRRPYFISGDYEAPTLYILPENMSDFDAQLIINAKVILASP